MINLVSPEVRKHVLYEYWTRVASAWGLLFAVALFALSTLMIPTVVLLNSQLDAVSQGMQRENEFEVNFKEAEQIIKDTNILTNQLIKETSHGNVKDVIDAINGAVSDDIEMAAYIVRRTEGIIDAVHIQGTAATRSALTAFKTDLERSARFDSAIVPISDLARNADLPFAIEVVLATQQ